MNARLDFIDTAKGIGMLIVIILHTFINYPDNSYIGSFIHLYTSSFFMPLFFFLSGLFFSCKIDFVPWLKKKYKRLIVPYICFYILTYILNLLLHELNVTTKNPFHYIDIFQVFWKDIFSNNVIWFLLSLFWCNVIMYIVLKYSKKMVYEIICIIFVFFAGYYCSYNNINIPLYIDTSLSSLPIIYIGYIFKRYKLLEQITKKMSISFVIITLSSVLVYLSIQGISLVSNVIRNPILFLLGGVSGSILVTFISFYIKQIPIITFIGRNSLLVLCTHMYLINFYVKIFNKINILYGYEYYIIILLVCVSYYGLTPIFKRYLPFMIGESK